MDKTSKIKYLSYVKLYYKFGKKELTVCNVYNINMICTLLLLLRLNL